VSSRSAVSNESVVVAAVLIWIAIWSAFFDVLLAV
jgi:hypothetical protein